VLIDWFTVGAQIINFLILIWLLRRFLYGPIMKAMHARAERVASELREAREARREAQEQQKRLAQERAELEAERGWLKQQAKEEVAAWREQAMERVRREVEDSRDSWLDGLRNEQERAMDQLKRRIASQVLEVSQAVLTDMADQSLQVKAADTFLARLGKQKAQGELDAFTDYDGEPRLRVPEGLPDQVLDRLRTGLAELFPKAGTVRIQPDGDFLLGLSLVAGDRKWDFGLSGYLDALEQDILAGILPERAKSQKAEPEEAGTA